MTFQLVNKRNAKNRLNMNTIMRFISVQALGQKKLFTIEILKRVQCIKLFNDAFGYYCEISNTYHTQIDTHIHNTQAYTYAQNYTQILIKYCKT